MRIYCAGVQQRHMTRRLGRLVTLLVFVSAFGVAPFPALSAGAPRPVGVPGELVEPTVLTPGASRYTLIGAKIFWTTRGEWTCGEFPVHEGVQSLSRIATSGGAVRQLFLHEPTQCEGAASFNQIVADEQYIYWTDVKKSGLYRLSTNANVGDAPELVVSQWTAESLAIDANVVYGSERKGGVTAIRQVAKTGGPAKTLIVVDGAISLFSTDGEYLYWRLGSTLARYALASSNVTTLASGVTGYYAEGAVRRCILFCGITRYVFIAQGNRVVRYDNDTNTTSAPIYTSTDTKGSIVSLTTDQALRLFFFEYRPTVCPSGFCPYTALLTRTTISGGQAASIATESPVYDNNDLQLTSDGTFLFWNYAGVKRLPANIDALPLTNMHITGIEVTQGIQSSTNSVPLIRGRRTFVRVYVQADGASVPGVTMQLINDQGAEQKVVFPINDLGTHLTVQTTPSREDLNHSFLFELPLSWTISGLKLRAELNPYHVPLQQSYANNSLIAGPFTFLPSPRLEVKFMLYGYAINKQIYYPRLGEDLGGAYSWIARAYPLASAPGGSTDPSPGFRPEFNIVFDEELGSYVNRSISGCDELCASNYTNRRMAAARAEEGSDPSTFWYAMISDAAGFYPRGRADPEANVASGPAGAPTGAPFGDVAPWDTDATYGDWYAAHEIGHTLGRLHPASGSDDPETTGVDEIENCGHSRDGDLSKEHGDLTSARAPIGPADGSVMGFDAGNPNFAIPRALLTSAVWNDVMSYCPHQWISDYTYTAIYDYMIAHPSAATPSLAAASVRGDFISVFGMLDPRRNRAMIYHLRRLSEVAAIPPRSPGEYSIRLLGVRGNTLADYPFTPSKPADTQEWLTIGQVVPFSAGTREVQIVKLADRQILARLPVSEHAPTIGAVTLQGASSPVTGTATLIWDAADRDGDKLKFDVLASRDGGVSFTPLQRNLQTAQTRIDTTQLGGGRTIVRVIASDGANTAYASSAPIVIENKPPQPRIINPANGMRLRWGTLVNFMGEATDVQDGSISAAKLVWSDAKGARLGTGAVLTRDDLPVGRNRITLTATNSAGLSASTTILVIVDDDFRLPGPSLSIGPRQISWYVGSGVTAAQTAPLTISNAGGGELRWTASSNQPWLTVSAASGTIPAGGDVSRLTLTARITGLPTNQSYTARLTVVRPATDSAPAQTAVIPVSLYIGNQEDLPTRRSVIYLPSIGR